MNKISGWALTDCVRFSFCPKCNAKPGLPCRTPFGKKATEPHTKRSAQYHKDFPDRYYLYIRGPEIDGAEIIKKYEQVHNSNF